MRKRLVSILIANVLFLSNVGFTSYAVEQSADLAAVAASSEEKTDDSTTASSQEEKESEDVSGSFFDEDIEYVKISAFTELAEDIINQKVKVGESIDYINFPETLEITVVKDVDREERISEELGKERELIRQLEEEENDLKKEEENAEKSSSSNGEGKEPTEDDEELIYFFESDTEGAQDKATAESATEGESIEDKEGKEGNQVSDNSSAENSVTADESAGKTEDKGSTENKATSENAASAEASKAAESSTQSQAAENSQPGNENKDATASQTASTQQTGSENKDANATQESTTQQTGSESQSNAENQAAPEQQISGDSSGQDTGSGATESTASENNGSAASESGSDVSGSENAGNENAGSENTGSTENSTESSAVENLVGKITSVFKIMTVHAAENMEKVEEGSAAENSTEEISSEESSSEESTVEEAGAEETQSVEENTSTAGTDEANTEGQKSSDSAVSTDATSQTVTEESAKTTEENKSASEAGRVSGELDTDTAKTGDADNKTEIKEEVKEEESAEEVSIEMVSGVKWILDPLKNEYKEFSSEVVGSEFVFIPVLIIPDYYYIEAELPSIKVTVIKDETTFDEVATVDGVKIRVRADKGVFPEGATLSVQKLLEDDEQKVQAAVSEQLEEDFNVVKSYSFDIQIRDKDGKEIEPDNEKGRVIVSFETEEVSNDEFSADIYHIVEEETTTDKTEENVYYSSNDNKENNPTDESDGSKKDAEDSANSESATDSETADKADVIAESENAEESGSTDKSEAGADTSGDKATIEGAITAQKLECEIVDGEETKAIEAATDGFSVYSLVFSKDSNTVLPINGTYAYLEDASFMAKMGIAAISNVTVSAADGEFLLPVRLNHNQGVPYSTSGVYEENTTAGGWFLVVKKPFSDLRTITITPGTGATISVKVKLENGPTAGFGNNGFPYATDMGNNVFNLKIATVNASEVAGDTYDEKNSIYQWQYNTSNTDFGWTDIKCANTPRFGASITTAATPTIPTDFPSGYWYRCLVNGVASEPVKVVTPKGDTGITWPSNVKSSDTLCYVADEDKAYTIVSVGTGQKIFDVVFLDGSTMMRTTSDNNGWRIYTNQNGALSTTPSYHLDDMLFSFGENSIDITADLASGYANFAISANCAIDTVTNGTLYANNTEGSVSKVSYMEPSTLDKVLEYIKNKTGDLYDAFSVTPVTPVSKVWIGRSGKAVPYTTNNDKLLFEGTSASLAMSWLGIQDGSTVSFGISEGAIEGIEAIEEKSKVATFTYSNPGTVKTGITGARLYGNELSEYAESAGTAIETVSVDMSFKPVSTVDSDVLSSFATSISGTKGTLTSNTGDVTNVISTTSKPAYIVDFIDISVDETKDGSIESKDELKNGTKDAVVTVELDYANANKSDIKIARYHDNTVQVFKAGSKSKKTDQTYYLDKNNNKIYLHTNKFSTYAIAYKADSGYTVTLKDGTTTLSTVDVKTGGKVEKPKDPSKDGYEFVGWTLSSNTVTLSTTNSSSIKIYDFNTAVTKDITLNTVWRKLHTVTFDNDNTKWTVNVSYGGKVAKPNDPSKAGYVFAGWTTTKVSTTSTATTVSTYNFDTAVTKDFTLYAYYKKVHTVTFDNGTNKWTASVINGEKVAKPSPDPTRAGYVFKGWYLSGSTTSSALSSSSTSLTRTSASSASAYNFDKAVTSDITLIAGWTSLEESQAAATSGSSGENGAVNGARAPKTSDTLPAVWLWVLLLVAGVTTIGLSIRELNCAQKGLPRARMPKKLRRTLLLIGIIVTTTWKFILKKIRQNKLKFALAVSGAVVIIAALMISTTLFQYHKSETIYSEADETYVEVTAPQESEKVEPVIEAKTEVSKEKNFSWWDCAQVNLSELQKEYPDVIGWIYFENEDISYPILYSGDNVKYLRRTYTGQSAKAGSIFIDGESSPDFSDPHSLIYGHNMHDLTMFGKLRYYRTNPEYYRDHQYFQIFTKDKVYRYQIYVYEEVADNHDVFWVYGKEPTGYFEMLKEIEDDSYVRSGITANESDHVITLATCTSKDNERLIVSAIRTDEYEYAQ